MPNQLHSHGFAGGTSFADGHAHQYMGVTSLDMDYPGHVHLMADNTSFVDGHLHAFRLVTSPAIYFAGGHYHLYRGATEVADRHTHNMQGPTIIYAG